MKKAKTVRRNYLQWQIEGIQGTHKEAIAYIKKLNREKVNGYDNWRLPTLEEAFKLVEKEKGFKKTQKQFGGISVWVSNKFSASCSWFAHFPMSRCTYDPVDCNDHYVRAVRSINKT